MSWIILFIAGLLEVVWAIGLKYTHGFTRLTPSVITVTAMIVSIVLLSWAMRFSARGYSLCRLDRHWCRRCGDNRDLTAGRISEPGAHRQPRADCCRDHRAEAQHALMRLLYPD